MTQTHSPKQILRRCLGRSSKPGKKVLGMATWSRSFGGLAPIIARTLFPRCLRVNKYPLNRWIWGLAGTNWYATIIPRKEMKEFTDVLMGPPFGTHSFGWLLYSDLPVLALLFGLPGGLPPSGSLTAYFMDHLQIVDGTNAAMARPSRRAG